MFDRFAVIFAAIAAVPVASVPAPSATPKPVLREIVHVRSSAKCGDIATHANGAISLALHNDATLAQTIARLRTVDLDDGNTIHRRNRLDEIGNYARTLMEQARAGDDEVKRLRAVAEKSTNPEEAKDLKAFADQLGGALWRQQKIARDLNGFLASVDFRDMKGLDESQKQANRGVFGVDDPTKAISLASVGGQPPDGPLAATLNNAASETFLTPFYLRGSLTEQARSAADDFELRIPDISNDEALAADHIEAATAGC
jgi:hypothetical protein